MRQVALMAWGDRELVRKAGQPWEERPEALRSWDAAAEGPGGCELQLHTVPHLAAPPHSPPHPRHLRPDGTQAENSTLRA